MASLNIAPRIAENSGLSKLHRQFSAKLAMHQPSFPNLRLICAGTGYNLRAPDLFGLWLSLARAPRSGRGGRGFESHQPDVPLDQ